MALSRDLGGAEQEVKPVGNQLLCSTGLARRPPNRTGHDRPLFRWALENYFAAQPDKMPLRVSADIRVAALRSRQPPSSLLAGYRVFGLRGYHVLVHEHREPTP